MAFYDKFPYTNFQELNLDWLTQEVSKVRDNRDASDASAAAALASEQAAKASETAAASSQQAAANSETAAAGSAAASADYLAQIGTHTAGAVADWLKDNITPTTPAVDASLTIAGAAADAKVTGNALNIVQGYDWSFGYVQTDGRIVTNDHSRKYSRLLICPANEEITYIAEKHANICGISFYNSNGTFIGGVTYTGESAENTVVSPENAVYFRLSTRVDILSSTYAKFNTNGLTVLNKRIESVTNRLSRYIPFITNGTNRSLEYTDISDMTYAEIVDNSYDFTVYYTRDNGTIVNTGWIKKINLLDYPTAINMLLRRSDNGVMPWNSALNVAVCERTTDIVIRDELSSYLAGFVDGANGSDENSGISWKAAFATIQKAIDEGFKTIRVKPGTYAGGITMTSLKGIKIFGDKAADVFDPSTSPDNSKVIIDCDSTLDNGVSLTQCADCSLSDIEVKNATGSGFKITGCLGLKIDNCVAHDIPNGQGFEIRNTNADFMNCGAYNIGTMGGGQHHDGFNIHGTGTTNFMNCWGNTCEDDGISHHDACKGFIDGGEWYNCGKGGVASPTHGSKINICNVYSHNNRYGLYADNEYSDLVRTFNISNCAFKNNSAYDIETTNNTANIWNCIYDTINHRDGGSNNVIS